MIYRTVIVFIILSISHAFANSFQYYYGKRLNDITHGHLQNDELKTYLHQVLDSYHITKDNTFDEIVSICPSDNEKKCYRHQGVDYETARKKLFGMLFLEDISSEYILTCVYCQYHLGPEAFPEEPRPGIDIIPNNRYINTEHTWPQSKFSKVYPTTLQKSDLHALFPVTPAINTIRSNHDFGEVYLITSATCSGTKIGYISSDNNNRYFEPPNQHKGNVARALFYFAIRYAMDISNEQEVFLKRWHKLDPVDESERWRNEEIFKIQKNRNPFVDHPWMVELINDY